MRGTYVGSFRFICFALFSNVRYDTLLSIFNAYTVENTERKLPNISEKYRFRKFELPIIRRKSDGPWHFE